MIKHNLFSETVQSLGYVPPGKERSVRSVGMMAPGEHNFKKPMERNEIIRVTFGAIWINETLCQENDEILITPGTVVVFKASELSGYICFFPDEED